MKLSLVATQGKGAGKVIPITLAQFVIGRDPQCHLRTANPVISKRHCALLIRGERAFVRDFGSTNGTLVNEERIQGERELHDQDQLKIGPLLFTVRLERIRGPVPVPQSAAPQVRPGAGYLDEDPNSDVLQDMRERGDAGETSSGGDAMMRTLTNLPRPAGLFPGPGRPADKKDPDKDGRRLPGQ